MARTTLTVVLTAAALAGCTHGSAAKHPERVTAVPPAFSTTTQLLGPSGELRGTVALSSAGAGTHVIAHVEGLPPGTYAIHLHAVGKCDAPGFTTAGPHFNPDGHQHGALNPAGPHLGDLPNVIVDRSGTGSIDATIAGLQLTGGATPLLGASGAAVVLHAGADDYRTDPSGNSGARIACGALAPR